jgi:hypothetical protein
MRKALHGGDSQITDNSSIVARWEPLARNYESESQWIISTTYPRNSELEESIKCPFGYICNQGVNGVVGKGEVINLIEIVRASEKKATAA